MTRPTRAALAGWLRGYRPQPLTFKRSDYLRAGFGSLFGLLAAAWSATILNVGPADLPYIVAPMGASAVLLFAAPASPLAQPWSVIGGNIISAFIGVAAGRLLPDPAIAAAIAVAVAITVMSALHCLHPPGGACALFAAVATGPVESQGFLFAVFPVAVNSVLLLLAAIAVNNLTGRPYPHLPPPAPTGPPSTAGQRVGLRLADIQEAIRSLDQGLDVLPGDVLALVQEAEARALDRQLGRLVVRSVMEPDVITVREFETVYRVRVLFTDRHIKAVPVIDGERRVIGIITIYDLFRVDMGTLDPVTTIMSSPVTTVRGDEPVASLVALMTERGLRHIPVVDDQDQIIGIVTRTELIAVLNRALVASRRP